MVGNKCCVLGCKSNYNFQYVSTFKLPKDAQLKELWLKAISRPNFTPSKHTAVCVKHFEEDLVITHDVLPTSEGDLLIKRGAPKLKVGACPTKFMVPPENFKERKKRDKSVICDRPAKKEKRAQVQTVKCSAGPLEHFNVKKEIEENVISSRPAKRIKRKTLKCSEEDLETRSPDTTSNATASKGEPIPLEPTVVIKEEPIEFEPAPSTSADSDCLIKDEFILPYEESAWTSADSRSSSGVEPSSQATFSVGCLGTDQDKTSSTTPVLGDPLKRKRKDNPSKLSVSGPAQKVARTSLDSGNVPTECLQPPSVNADDSSNLSSLFESKASDRHHDQFDAFAEYIAAKLQILDKRSCAFAQKAIGDIIFDAEMGKFIEGTK